MNRLTGVSVLFSLLLVNHVRSQIISFGGCPKVQAMNHLKIAAVSGKWFEIAKYTSMFASGECASVEFELVNDKNISLNVRELVKGKNASYVQYGKIESPGVWNFQLKTPISKFLFKFAVMRSELTVNVPENFDAKYYILDTDYTEFAAVFACESVSFVAHGRMVWILSRSQKLSEAAKQKAYNAIRRNRLDLGAVKTSDQTGCS